MDQLYFALEFALLGAALAAAVAWLIFRRRAPQPPARTSRPARPPEAASAPPVARPEPPRTDARFAAATAALRPAADTARLVEAVVRETGIEHALVARVVEAALARNAGAAQPPRRPAPVESLLAATAEAATPPTPPVRPSAAPAPLIMVVDDSVTVRVFAQRLLKAAGYRVVLAEDGLDALERLKEERPSVVLADIEMPRMDGFDLARHIRADGAMAHMPIIVITSRIAHKHREYARQIGVNHYLGKPYAPEELIQLVRRYAVAGSAVAA